MLIPVNTILSNLDNHFVTLWPSSWSWASDGSGVDVFDLRFLWRELKSSWSEFTFEVLWVSVVRELVTIDVDHFTTFDGSHVWVDARHHWFLVVSESEVSEGPVDTVEGHLEVKFSINAWSCWRSAHKSHRRVKVSSDNGVTELAVWNDTILWLVVEPGTENFDESATLGETSTWENLKNVWNSVSIELNA